MRLRSILLKAIVPLFFFASCKDAPKDTTTAAPKKVTVKKDSLPQKSEKEAEPEFVLTEDNAIDFFFNYSKTLTENTVRITTDFGQITIELFDNVPYHKANFIYLTKKGYFKNTYFHRVVKDFIIQGGNADNAETGKKRSDIGRYLLPPDTDKGHRHHRGTVSMPSSAIDNPHMLASPYEFFIVVTSPGSYHLDGEYTAFGKVVEGMDVVDEINAQPVDEGDWPSRNIYITDAEVIR